MILLALLACSSPDVQLAAREAVWWGEVGALERSEGLSLVAVEGAEPVGYWPRVVVYPDHVSVDDRAWFLALPDEVRDASRDALVEVPEAARLTGGRFPSGEGLVEPGLLEVLETLHQAVSSQDQRVPLPLVPDATVPAETLARVLHTAGQARFDSWGLGVASAGRLRNVLVSATSCTNLLTLQVTDGASALRAEEGPPLLPVGGACPAAPGDLVGAAEALAAACASRWTPDDRCFDVTVTLGETTAAVALRTLGALLASPADLRTAPLSLGSGVPACAFALPVDQLSEDQLDVVCLGPTRADRQTGGRRSFLVGGGGPDPRTRQAFPAWAAAGAP